MKKRVFLAGTLLLIVILTYSRASFADTIVEVGFHLGGDELIQEPYTNGETGSLKAGNMFSFYLGGLKQYTEQFEGQFSLGIKSDVIYSGDVEVSWVRYPLNAMLFYRAEKFRVGLGVTNHFSPKVKGNDFASNVTQSYKDALGAEFEVDFNLKPGFLWGIRFTKIEYETTAGDRIVNGDSVGVLLIAQL